VTADNVRLNEKYLKAKMPRTLGSMKDISNQRTKKIHARHSALLASPPFALDKSLNCWCSAEDAKWKLLPTMDQLCKFVDQLHPN